MEGRPMLQLPDPEPGYAWARLEGGPLNGEIVLAPIEAHRRDLPAPLIGVLAPVLDEAAETIAWERVNYVCTSAQPIPPKSGDVWVYVAVPGRADGEPGDR
jgi:hypothetical protein